MADDYTDGGGGDGGGGYDSGSSSDSGGSADYNSGSDLGGGIGGSADTPSDSGMGQDGGFNPARDSQDYNDTNGISPSSPSPGPPPGIAETLLTGAVDLFTGKAFGGGITGSLAGMAAAGLLMYGVSKIFSSSSSTPAAPPDRGQTIQTPPGQDVYIPVLYGTSTIAGTVTEVVMSSDNLTMYYCITLCEKTGNLMSTGAASVYNFNTVYWNDAAITFQADGVTVASLTDRAGVVSTKLAGMIKVYCYVGGSGSQIAPTGATIATATPAYSVIPTWTSTCTMDNLVFCVVKVTYNLAAGATGLGTITSNITNSMTQPGDVMYDYMTNTVYGCGIDPTTIAA